VEPKLWAKLSSFEAGCCETGENVCLNGVLGDVRVRKGRVLECGPGEKSRDCELVVSVNCVENVLIGDA